MYIISISIYIYIYIYIYYTRSASAARPGPRPPTWTSERDKSGAALMGSLQILCFLTEGLLGYFPLTYFYLPRSAGLEPGKLP